VEPTVGDDGGEGSVGEAGDGGAEPGDFFRAEAHHGRGVYVGLVVQGADGGGDTGGGVRVCVEDASDEFHVGFEDLFAACEG